MGCHQFRFSIETGPAVRQRHAECRFRMNTDGIRIIFTYAGKAGDLTVGPEIKYPEVIFIIIEIQLRLSTVGCCIIIVGQDLELFGGYGGIPVRFSDTHSQFLCGVAVSGVTVSGSEIGKIARVTDFGVVRGEPPVLGK